MFFCFSVPVKPTLRAKWVAQIEKHQEFDDVILTYLVCADHFDNNDIQTNGSRKVLKKGALPRYFPEYVANDSAVLLFFLFFSFFGMFVFFSSDGTIKVFVHDSEIENQPLNTTRNLPQIDISDEVSVPSTSTTDTAAAAAAAADK